MPTWIKAIIMGIVEGLTEFLPVSSTGHLMVVGRALEFDSELFVVFIQLGALAAVWWLYRERIIKMIPWGPAATAEGRRILWLVIIGFLPVAVVGIKAHHWIKETFPSESAIAWAFIIGGLIILLIESFKPRVIVDTLEKLTPKLALFVGIGQCLSLFPGVSRSGATIMAGLVVGLSRSVATEYTFLLAVPTMSAAVLVQLIKYHHELTSSMIGYLAIGFVVSYITAFVVVKWFIRFVQSHTFSGFAVYRIIAGLILFGLIYKNFFNR